MPVMLPAVDAKNLTPSSTELASFTVTIDGTLVVGNRLYPAVKTKVAEPVPFALVALSVTLEVPAAVGVPEITPVVVLTESPAGNPVAVKLVGLLLAVIV
jgi:hypothetical protein